MDNYSGEMAKAGAENSHHLRNQATCDGGQDVHRVDQCAAKSPFPGEREPHLGLQGYSSQELGLANIEDVMRYQPWDASQQIQGDEVRDALLHAAKVILRNVPRSPRRTIALQKLIEARMDANAAISFRGRF